MGLKDRFRGWVDVQNQGVPNDYAYYVGPTQDLPYVWLTIALAGSTEQRTRFGMYEEKYGVVRNNTSFRRKTYLYDVHLIENAEKESIQINSTASTDISSSKVSSVTSLMITTNKTWYINKASKYPNSAIEVEKRAKVRTSGAYTSYMTYKLFSFFFIAVHVGL